MKRLFAFVLVSAVGISAFSIAQTGKLFSPDAVSEAMEKFSKARVTFELERREKTREAAKEVLAALEELKKAAMKAGDLDAANNAQAQIESVKTIAGQAGGGEMAGLVEGLKEFTLAREGTRVKCTVRGNKAYPTSGAPLTIGTTTDGDRELLVLTDGPEVWTFAKINDRFLGGAGKSGKPASITLR
jgi:hypothetical protein